MLIICYTNDVSSFVDTAINLQRQLIEINNHCSEICINLDKSKIPVFKNDGEHWVYNDNKIDGVNCKKYLGT